MNCTLQDTNRSRAQVKYSVNLNYSYLAKVSVCRYLTKQTDLLTDHIEAERIFQAGTGYHGVFRFTLEYVSVVIWFRDEGGHTGHYRLVVRLLELWKQGKKLQSVETLGTRRADK